MKKLKQNLMIIFLTICTASVPAKDTILAAIEEWPPFRIKTTDEKSGKTEFTGIDIELLNRIAKEMNIIIKIERFPWARCLENMKTGEADIITGIAYSTERAEYVNYVQPSYWKVEPVFYTQKGNRDILKSYEDLYKVNVGYSIRSVYFEPFNSDVKIKKHSIATEEQLLRMIDSGRIDVIIGTEPNISWDAVRYGFKKTVEPTAYKPDIPTLLYIGISGKSAFNSRAAELSKVIEKLIKNGTMEKIADHYR